MPKKHITQQDVKIFKKETEKLMYELYWWFKSLPVKEQKQLINELVHDWLPKLKTAVKDYEEKYKNQ